MITVDNASYMTVAVELSGANLKLGCFAHTLNLASNKALGMPSLDKLLDKVRSVELVALQLPKHKLIMDCKDLQF